MSEIVERVALAMCNVDNKRFDLPLLESVEDFRFDHDRSVYEELAHAAIEAMREPTDAQIKACIDAAETIQGGGWIEVYKRIYRIMIDTALSKASPSGEEQP